MTYSYFSSLTDQLPEIPANSILSQTVYSEDSLKVILFGFAQGEELSEHTAARPAILHFLTGDARLTLGPDEMEAHAGTWVHMPPKLPHSVYAKTPVTMLLMLL